MRSLLLALALVGCSSAPDDEPPCASLDGAKLVYDLTRISATTPECRKAMSTVDLASGAFELQIDKRGTSWEVTTGGATYPATVDEARGCTVSWDTSHTSTAGVTVRATGTLDRANGTGSVHYAASSDSAACEATLEGTAR